VKIQIDGFRGVRHLEVDVDGLLLLAGPNAAGKTSACAAIAATASGKLLPFEGLKKNNAELLVNDDAKAAACMLSIPEGMAVAAWPAVERVTEGRFIDSSLAAVGFEDITTLKQDARAERLQELIHALPTEEELKKALKEADVTNPKLVEAIIADLPKGWDAMHAKVQKEGAKLKGQWEGLTGERYGSAKAPLWRPKGWPLELESLSLEALWATRNAAYDAVLELTRNAGTDEGRRAALEETARNSAGVDNELTSARGVLALRDSELEAARKALGAAGARPVLGEPPFICPCCGAAVRLYGGGLQVAAAEDLEAQQEALAAYLELEKAVTKAETARSAAAVDVGVLTKKAQTAREAQAQLDAMPKATTAPQELEAAKAASREADERHQMKQNVIAASTLAEKIALANGAAKVLAPDGVRKDVLVERLGDFNGELVAICQDAFWEPVHIDADMSISYGGRPLSLCSASEQFRAKVTLQIAIAEREKAPVVVIDGADILDRAGRNGLFNTLADRFPLTVIGMTILKREDMPYLAKAGLGASVWIEGGAVPVEQTA